MLRVGRARLEIPWGIRRRGVLVCSVVVVIWLVESIWIRGISYNVIRMFLIIQKVLIFQILVVFEDYLN